MMEANQFWKIDVYSIGEPIQFIDYPVGKEYFYHIDNSPGGGSVRKITMVTQLSEDYERICISVQAKENETWRCYCFSVLATT